MSVYKVHVCVKESHEEYLNLEKGMNAFEWLAIFLLLLKFSVSLISSTEN